MSDQSREFFQKYGHQAMLDAYEHKDDREVLKALERALISGLAYVVAVKSQGHTDSLIKNLKTVKNQLHLVASRESCIIMHNNERLATNQALLELLNNDNVVGAKARLESMIKGAATVACGVMKENNSAVAGGSLCASDAHKHPHGSTKKKDAV